VNEEERGALQIVVSFVKSVFSSKKPAVVNRNLLRLVGFRIVNEYPLGQLCSHLGMIHMYFIMLRKPPEPAALPSEGAQRVAQRLCRWFVWSGVLRCSITLGKQHQGQ
jgi:hypothetical protein